ncbi:MAG: FMN-binding domain protein [bacterium ADurb.BinA028]|nr:MAG: FMN-binding domain protein [bacterium ADurb.BinA028]
MSTRSKTAAALASAGILLVGWNVGTANGKTVSSTTAAGTTTSTTLGTTSSGTTGSGTTSGTTSSGTTSSGTTSGTTSSGTTSGTTSSGTTSGTTSSGTTSSGTTSTATGTYTGTTKSDRWGTITVTVTLVNGKITDITYKTTVGDNRSAQIEARSIPVLKAAVLAANSTDVSTVSGATYTTKKYLSSLQSALDQAA